MSLRSAAPALGAALLFGASTPLAKTLTGTVSPILLAGLLYLGSGLGLAGFLLARRLMKRGTRPPPARRRFRAMKCRGCSAPSRREAWRAQPS